MGGFYLFIGATVIALTKPLIVVAPLMILIHDRLSSSQITILVVSLDAAKAGCAFSTGLNTFASKPIAMAYKAAVLILGSFTSWMIFLSIAYFFTFVVSSFSSPQVS